ncbi:MAG: ribosome assembly factor SBDS [Desulfurococcales archaeon]|nr:ribosome assembly factor SBDS [Desulfurococcales archaeon]MEB3789785.1 ribosome assembly factor SBDS [Desulfurococcales archaeon]
MGRKQDYIVAWTTIKGKRFEILVRPDPAFKFKEGEKVDLDDVLWTDTIYRDVKKGLKASPEEVKKAFGTDDVKKIAVKILKEGEIQLTEDQRRKLIEAKKRQIITYIARNAIDPKTGKPIPEARIETAFEQLRIGVDPFKSAESQALEAVRQIARLMPIRIAKALVRALVPAQYSGRVYKELRRLGEVKRTDWQTDGSLLVELEIPAGSQIDVVSRLQNLTRGSAKIDVKVVK